MQIYYEVISYRNLLTSFVAVLKNAHDTEAVFRLCKDTLVSSQGLISWKKDL